MPQFSIVTGADTQSLSTTRGTGRLPQCRGDPRGAAGIPQCCQHGEGQGSLPFQAPAQHRGLQPGAAVENGIWAPPGTTGQSPAPLQGLPRGGEPSDGRMCTAPDTVLSSQLSPQQVRAATTHFWSILAQDLEALVICSCCLAPPHSLPTPCSRICTGDTLSSSTHLEGADTRKIPLPVPVITCRNMRGNIQL